MAFGTASDVATIVQRDLSAADTATVIFLLDIATDVVKTLSGQQFTSSTTTNRLRPRRGKIRLPQRPVTAVTAVTTTDTPPVAVDYAWDGFDTIAPGPAYTLNGFELNGSYGVFCVPLLVTYTHGYATIPTGITGLVVQMAARAFGIPSDQSGRTQESIQGYAYQVGGVGGSGPIGVLPDELRYLQTFGRQVGCVMVGP